MRVSDVLRDIGRPVAYYPGLAKPLGGVKAAVLFCQIFYWHSRAMHELGVHKTADELAEETGLSYEEQRAARKALKQKGVLIETEKRLEHKIYFRIDEDALERVVDGARAISQHTDSGAEAKSANAENPTSPNGKSPFREVDKVHSADRSNPSPPTVQIPVRGEGTGQFVNGVKTTAETTAESSSNANARDAVDNSAAESLLLPEREKPAQPSAGDAHSGGELPQSADELAMASLLQGLEQERGKRCAISMANDRHHLQDWLNRGVTLKQLRDAHRRAAAARDRDQDARPINAGFLARFVDEVVSKATAPSDDGALWWESSPEVIDARGVAAGVRPRKPDEALPYYRVLVAKATGEKAAVEYVLRDAQKFNDEKLYSFARETFGDALLPVDY